MDDAAAAAALAVIASARDSVDLGPFGYAAFVSEPCKAYKALLAEPERLRAWQPRLEQLTRDGPGARRVYAALLLGSVDPAAGRAALMTMRGSDEPCALHEGGCSVFCMWLGETVDSLLGEDSGVDPRRAIDQWLRGLENGRQPFVRDPDVLTGSRRLRAAADFASLRGCELEHLATRRPQLEVMVRSHEPTVRLYAALLLERLDANGNALLALANDDTGLWELDAVRETWTTVAAVARSYVHPARLAALPPAPPTPPRPSSPRNARASWLSRLLEHVWGL